MNIVEIVFMIERHLFDDGKRFHRMPFKGEHGEALYLVRRKS